MLICIYNVSTFLDKEELLDIFGRDLLDDIALSKYFKQLTGEEKTKPFECVGTRDEVNEAINMLKEKYADNLPALLR